MLLCLPLLTVGLIGLHVYAFAVCGDANARHGIVATAVSVSLLIAGAMVFAFASFARTWPVGRSFVLHSASDSF